MHVFSPSLKRKSMYLFLYLFTWLHWVFVAAHGLSIVAANGGVGATLHCGVWASHFSGFSCCGAWVPRHLGSVVAVQGLNWPMACGIFPDQGLDRCPLH